jgi:hypothetical protein
MQSLGYASPLCVDSGAGEEVVRSGDCQVAAGSCGIVLCVPAEGFQLAAAE